MSSLDNDLNRHLAEEVRADEEAAALERNAAAYLLAHKLPVVSDASCDLPAKLHDEVWLALFDFHNVGLTLDVHARLLALAAAIAEASARTALVAVGGAA